MHVFWSDEIHREGTLVCVCERGCIESGHILCVRCDCIVVSKESMSSKEAVAAGDGCDNPLALL